MNDIPLIHIPVLGTLNITTLLITLLFLIMYDFVSTYIAVTHFTDLVEGNPLIHYMSLEMFLCGKLIFTYIGLHLLIYMYQYKPNTVSIGFIILIILYSIIFINNTYQIGRAIYV